ncbi:retrovirus-related pol polyprotein from transposon TNT 1-94 [Tanacetum coccineum]
MEPGTSQGSDTSVALSSSSLIDCSTVKFGNDQVAKIMGYGDYQIGNVTISRVKFLASKDEASGFIIKFLKMIQVRLNATVRNIRIDNGTEFVNQTLRAYYEQVGISHETSVARTPQQNGVVERRNLFDEFCSPPASVASLVPVEEAQAPVESTGSPFSTTVDQDAPSLKESHDLEVAHMSNDPYFGIPILETISEESSLSDVIPTTVHLDAPISKHLSKWTKDHLLQNINGDPSRPVSTSLQLYEQALFCYYDAFLTSVEPKTYKDALTQSCWIEAMQEELHKFEHLKVCELVSRPDKVMVITLKWIYKVKLDELGGILKNKARLVARRYHNPNHVYRVKKALYGLKQALCAWYDLLSSILLSQGFSKGAVDLTLFISRKGKDIILISQSPRGIFLNQSKYALESLKKYGMESCDPVDTPMVEKSKLDEDTQGKAIDPTHYRGMARPIEKYLHAVKRIFRYLKGTANRGLWYSKDSAIALTAFTDVDHTGCQHTRRSTSGKQVENGVVELYFVRTEYQLADIFTKALCRERIEFLIDKLGMRSFTAKTLKELADEAEE